MSKGEREIWRDKGTRRRGDKETKNSILLVFISPLLPFSLSPCLPFSSSPSLQVSLT
jgi:hypothetical protein